MNKNGFLTFLFSIVPGAGHMYLGYMKRGAFYMISFWAMIALAVFFSSSEVYMLVALTFFTLPVIWFYAMFESMHLLKKMRRDQVEMPEDTFALSGLDWFTRNKRMHKIVAIILIVLGVFFLLSTAGDQLLRRIVSDWNDRQDVKNIIISSLIAVGLIAGGVKLMLGTKKSKGDEEV